MEEKNERAALLEAVKTRIETGLLLTNIPEHMHEGILLYVFQGIPTGSFLEHVFSNRFIEMAISADQKNLHSLKNYAEWLYNYAPANCKGSPEAYQLWISRGGLDGAWATDGPTPIDAALE